MVRSLAKHSGFFKKKDKNTIPETDMQENVAQMMEEPIDQDPVQEENNFVNELSNMIHPIEIEKPKSWYKLAKASGFILLAAIGLLAGSMASQADNAKFVSTIEHIIDHNTMP